MRKVMSRWDHKSERPKKTPTAAGNSSSLALIRDSDESAPLLASSQHSVAAEDSEAPEAPVPPPSAVDGDSSSSDALPVQEDKELEVVVGGGFDVEQGVSQSTGLELELDNAPEATSENTSFAVSVDSEQAGSASAPVTPTRSLRTAHGVVTPPLPRPHHSAAKAEGSQSRNGRQRLLAQQILQTLDRFSPDTTNSPTSSSSSSSSSTTAGAVAAPANEFEAQTPKGSDHEGV